MFCSFIVIFYEMLLLLLFLVHWFNFAPIQRNLQRAREMWMRKKYIIESKVMSKAHLSHVIHQLHTHTPMQTHLRKQAKNVKSLFSWDERVQWWIKHTHTAAVITMTMLYLSLAYSIKIFLIHSLVYNYSFSHTDLLLLYFFSLTHSRISLSQLNYNQFSEIFFSLDDKRMYEQMMG